MKKIYQAPTTKAHKLTSAELICESPNSGYSTQPKSLVNPNGITEEKNVVFEAKGSNGWGEEW